MRSKRGTSFEQERKLKQNPSSIFLRELRKQACGCNFAQLTDTMIRDQIVFGTNNSKLREKMLKEKDLTLLKAEQICKAAEVSAQQNEVWAQAEKQVALVKKCAKCNRPHEPGRCPAFGR